MGSPEFAVPSLNALILAGHDVVAVYTQPPRPAGRRKGERKTAVQDRAEQLGLELHTPTTLREPGEQSRFRGLEADIAIVAAYGLILPEPILQAPGLGCLNIHASLLPRWRGAAPIQRAILADDEISGVTLMQMDAGLDTGPMLARQTLDIRNKNAGEVTDEMAQIGSHMLLEWFENPTPPEPQPVAGATYAPKIDKAESRIDWTQPAKFIERQVRAFTPVPGSWFEVFGERIKLAAASAVEISGKPGEVLDDQLTIAAGAGGICPLIVQRAGRAPMKPEEFLRGFNVPVGTILS